MKQKLLCFYQILQKADEPHCSKFFIRRDNGGSDELHAYIHTTRYETTAIGFLSNLTKGDEPHCSNCLIHKKGQWRTQ